MESGLTPDMPDVRVFPNVSALTAAVARSLVEALGAVIAGARRVPGTRCALALAGGNTPRALYGLLGSAYRDALPWENVHVFWGDERYVPSDDPLSNARTAKEAWLDQIAIPPANVHPMPTDLPDPDAAARAYEVTLRAHFSGAWPRFDLILLGMGADGHTASLFPGSPALDERERWVVAARAPVEPPVRLTLTLPLINQAAAVWFLVSGAEKAEALKQTLGYGTAQGRFPAAGVRPDRSELIWWVDRAAAGLLGQLQRPREAPRG